jgi:MFS family permease
VTAPSLATPNGARAAFRSPAFRRYQVARFSSVLGLQMMGVAVGWQIYDLTRRPLDLGLVGLVQFVPAVMLWPLAGVVVDRFDRRRVVMVTMLGIIVTAALLSFWASRALPTPAPIYATLVLLAVSRAFAAPAQQALLPQLVPRADFPNAVTWSSTLFQLGAVVGPALGGGIYALTGGAQGVYLTAMVLVAAAFLAMTTVRPLEAARPRTPPGLADLFEGVRHVTARPVILGALSLDLFAVLLGGAVALLPVFARDELAVGPGGLGVLRAAPAVGAAAMALLLAHRPVGSRAGRKLLTAVAVFGVATIVFGLSRSFWLSVAALAVVGASDELSVVVRQTIVQIATPDHMRGRVSAVNFLFINLSNEIGELESGLTAHWFGARRAVVLGGLGTLLVVALTSRLAPALRDVDRLEDVR